MIRLTNKGKEGLAARPAPNYAELFEVRELQIQKP